MVDGEEVPWARKGICRVAEQTKFYESLLPAVSHGSLPLLHELHHWPGAMIPFALHESNLTSNVIIDPSVQAVERGESKENLHDSTVIWHFLHVGLTARWKRAAQRRCIPVPT